MFTGIVLEAGEIEKRKEISGGVRFFVKAPIISKEAGIGDSIAVDGCCLTVISNEDGILGFDLSPETLSRTIANQYSAGSKINLEPSLRLGDKMGGHFVTGHIDTVAEVIDLKYEGDFSLLSIKLNSDAKGMVAEKGSLAVNGVSLTVALWRRSEDGGTAEFALIPATLERTNLGSLRKGGKVNIEYDLIARYLSELIRKD